MECINFNKILNRDHIEKEIKNFLLNFEKYKNNLSNKRGIYIYGTPGCGKTEFVLRILKEMNYDVIKYDTSDIRNKNIIDTLTKENMADKNVLSLLKKKAKSIAIVMDEIDGMNTGDKGGINSLIKLIRPKKTKKQKIEEFSHNPIICISNYYADKKIKELMKVCNVFELKSPSALQIKNIITSAMPNLDDNVLDNIINYINGDLKTLVSINNIYRNNNTILKNNIIQHILKKKSYNNDTKDITKILINNPLTIEDHSILMNETDRTMIGLLWHENIVDYLKKIDPKSSISLYSKMLNNICFADYMDRVTFQKQIWQFNEMSSLMKTFHCNKMYHDTFVDIKSPTINSTDIRFTKVLTKYSTEYNNSLFIQNLCQQLGNDKKDTFALFLELRSNHSEDEIYSLLEPYEINKLDIKRIYRYLDKNITNEHVLEEDELLVDTNIELDNDIDINI
jgi:DNA polymerase III delta prime subunit